MTEIMKERLALKILCALLSNQRTPYDAPKCVERLMRDSLDYADMWDRIVKGVSDNDLLKYRGDD